MSRAGASSLAELAAMRLPALLVPFPSAADNHQWHNARAFAKPAPRGCWSKKPPHRKQSLQFVANLIENTHGVRENMQAALAQWHAPEAADQIAENMLDAVSEPGPAVRLPNCSRDSEAA